MAETADHRCRTGDYADVRRSAATRSARPHPRLAGGDQPYGRLLTASPTVRGRRHKAFVSTWPIYSVHGHRRSRDALAAAVLAARRSSHVLEPVAQVFVRPNERLYQGKLAHSQRRRPELRLRRHHAVRTRQVFRLRPHRRRHARQPRHALFRRLRQWLDHQRAVRPVLPAWRARTPSPRPIWSMSAPSPACRPTLRLCRPGRLRHAARLAASVSGRFDEQTFEVRRTELTAPIRTRSGSLSATMPSSRPSLFTASPTTGTRSRSAHRRDLRQNWRVFGSGTYDLEADTLVRIRPASLQRRVLHLFDDVLAKPRPRHQGTTQSIGFNLSFRTLGDFGTNPPRSAPPNR